MFGLFRPAELQMPNTFVGSILTITDTTNSVNKHQEGADREIERTRKKWEKEREWLVKKENCGECTEADRAGEEQR